MTAEEDKLKNTLSELKLFCDSPEDTETMLSIISSIEKQFHRILSESSVHARQMAVENWISVEDRLPEITEGFFDCLVYRKYGEIRQARFNCKTERFQNMNFDNIHYSVTHWMPLPEPPKADTFTQSEEEGKG